MIRENRMNGWTKWCCLVLVALGMFLFSGQSVVAAENRLEPGHYRISESAAGTATRIWDVRLSAGLAKLSISEKGRIRYTLYLDLDMDISAMATTKRSNGRTVDFWIPRDYVQLELKHSDVPVAAILALVKGEPLEPTVFQLTMEVVEVADE